MSAVISFVGRSNSGKTTLLESLIGELKQRGHSVAAIKHSVHDLELDHPGKDSWRFAGAGSDAVVLGSPKKVVLIKRVDREATLEDLLKLIGDDYELILVEGFKDSNTPKIEVHREVLGGLVCSPEKLFAVVTDEPLNVSVPQFSFGQSVALVDLIEQRFLALAKV